MPQIISVNSEMISTLEYHEKSNKLIVEFTSGDKYSYGKVIPDLFLQLIDGDNQSIGRFFVNYIRNNPKKYPFKKLSQ